MIIEDKNSIKSVKSKYPKLTSEGAEQYFIELYNELRAKEDLLSNLRMKAQFLEGELKEKKDEFYKIKDLFDIEYGSKEVKEISNNMHLGIVTSDMDGRLH